MSLCVYSGLPSRRWLRPFPSSRVVSPPSSRPRRRTGQRPPLIGQSQSSSRRSYSSSRERPLHPWPPPPRAGEAVVLRTGARRSPTPRTCHVHRACAHTVTTKRFGCPTRIGLERNGFLHIFRRLSPDSFNHITIVMRSRVRVVLLRCVAKTMKENEGINRW